MTALADQGARDAALNVRDSVCISAPAGSGKTALLVQRCLALLARVESPERVVAITFTRKASAEMRARIMQWLRRAETGEEGANDFETAVLALAKAVLKRDAALDWGLLSNPTRLRIQTIDSFCGELTRQMPILSGCGGPLAPADNSEHLYREAIEACLQGELHSESTQRRTDVAQLLMHLDNRWESAFELLMGLLRRREQWQPVFGGAGLSDADRLNLRGSAEALVRFRLEQLRDLLNPWLGELSELMHYRAEHLESEVAFDPDHLELRSWQGVGRFLLTQKGDWRKSLTKREGFPAGKGPAAKRKTQALSLLESLAAATDGGLLQTLRQMSELPDTQTESDNWEVLASLTRLLPLLGAQLLLVFKQRGEVDHAQIAMAAVAALGLDEAPTDLALSLDHRIEHLLVDEFQDTSTLQFELVRRLTRGWREFNESNPRAPRTLLLVGDAMQSIYGFREANVGLFISARSEGIGDLRLTPLDLSVNFRSQSGLVSWVNREFDAAFPQADDRQLGAVQFRPATAARSGALAPEIQIFSGEEAQTSEINALCEKISQGLADEQVGSIAILGRSRGHLRPVLAALRERGIDASARDLDPLATRPLVRDLTTLCCLLFDTADRLAWFSLLRCPAIALDNADLLQIALLDVTPQGLLSEDEEVLRSLKSLTEIGRERLTHLAQLLRWAERFCDRLALRVWIEECWLRFGGASEIRTLADQQDAEQFFACLDKLEQERGLLNRSTLESAVENLYASPSHESSKLQVMTLHKAKGLEFDWVFIPSLSAATRSGEAELLLWEEFTLPGQPTSFLLDVRSSMEAKVGGRLYDYLKSQAKRRRQLEATRLFYVGCTRAADYLWLSGCLAWDEKKDSARAPGSASLLATIWPSLENRIEIRRGSALSGDSRIPTLAYRRLDDLPVIEPAYLSAQGSEVDLHDASFLPRALGTALHRCLESLVYRKTLPKSADAILDALLTTSLRELDTPSALLPSLEEEGRNSLQRVLQDDWARWMLSPERSERFAELALTHNDGSTVRQLVLDYVVVDEQNEERWVVDYKTATPSEGESVPAFMQRQLNAYAEQLEHYRAALQAQFPEPIRCALYFTALGQHCEWQIDEARTV